MRLGPTAGAAYRKGLTGKRTAGLAARAEFSARQDSTHTGTRIGKQTAVPIEQLLHSNPKLWRGCDMAGRGSHGLSTGYPALDEILPGRGWPRNGLVEIISKQWGMGELQLLLPLMRSVIAQGKWVLWISPPHQLYAPALVQAGIDIEQVLVVKAETSCRDALWSMEK